MTWQYIKLATIENGFDKGATEEVCFEHSRIYIKEQKGHFPYNIIDHHEFPRMNEMRERLDYATMEWVRADQFKVVSSQSSPVIY